MPLPEDDQAAMAAALVTLGATRQALDSAEEALMEARNRVFGKHPKTTFVSLHMGWPENLDWVQSMLDKYPNVMVEFGAREAELGRQPRRTHDLFLKFQDRVMFGADYPLLTYERLIRDWRAEGYSEEILTKVFHTNGAAFLADMGVAWTST